MRRFALLLVLLAGCGTPGTIEKQAEEVGSLAAEGTLLAHDASEGDTTETFTRVHARELRKKAVELTSKARTVQLEGLAASVADNLQTLAEYPGDKQIAALLERTLDDLSKHAEKIAKTAS